MKKATYIILIVFLMIILSGNVSAFSNDGSISCFAGTAKRADSVGIRLDSGFNAPYGLTKDYEGDLLVVDSYNHKIKKISQGYVSVVAGCYFERDKYGLPLGGYKDGEALKARFNRPRDAVVDSKGAIYVTDTGNHAIRKINEGKVTTFAGTGKAGYVDGTGKVAQFNLPSGIAIDKDDNLYIADTLNHVIRKINKNGFVSTWAGNKTETGGYLDGFLQNSLFNEPSDLCFNAAGDLFVADCGNQLIRRLSDNAVSTVAGHIRQASANTNYNEGTYADGAAFNAGFNFPKGILALDDGTLIIADTWNHMIRAVSSDGFVFTVAGTGTPGYQNDMPQSAELNGPVGLAYHQGSLYFTDMWNNSIRSLSLSAEDLELMKQKAELVNGITFDPVEEGKIQVWFDKRRIAFSDVKPYNADGKVMVPFRKIAEEWGAQVNWLNADNKMEVIKGSWRKTFTYGVDPMIINNNRTMIHIRYLAESMGFNVLWHPNYNAVVISTQ